MTKRYLSIRKLKEESLPEYLSYHQNIWPELEAEYREYGAENLSCFLNGCMLYAFLEVDEDRFSRLAARSDSVNARWQEIMKRFDDAGVPSQSAAEVYRLK